MGGGGGGATFNNLLWPWGVLTPKLDMADTTGTFRKSNLIFKNYFVEWFIVLVVRKL